MRSQEHITGVTIKGDFYITFLGAGACVLAFSTTDRASYEAVESWKNKVEAECGKIAMVVIQNKIDLLDQAVVKR
jgi:Ras-related protein Rab-23